MFDKHFPRWQDFPADKWRWPNFSPEEIACRDGSILVNERAMDLLQALRDKISKPFIVNSAYRSPTYNRKVGGAKHSQHLLGKAFDISMANHDPAAFEAVALEVGMKGIGHYPRQNFMHVDARDNPARWNKGGWFPKVGTFGAPVPPERDTEAAGEAKGGAVGAVLGSAGVALTGSLGSSLGALGEHAQLFAIGAGVLILLTGMFLFRRQIAVMIKGNEDI